MGRVHAARSRPSHELNLDSGAPAKKKKAPRKTEPHLYISYSPSAVLEAEMIKKALEVREFEWSDASTAAERDALLAEAMVQEIAGSDAVVVLEPKAGNLWTKMEVSTARSHGIPVVELDVRKLRKPSRTLTSKTIRAALDRAISRQFG
jgi:hypothetical protein